MSSRQSSAWLKALLLIEALVCFSPAAVILLIGAFMVPFQLAMLRAEPLLTGGPVYLISSVLAGFVGLGTLAYVLRSVLRGVPIQLPIPVLGGVLVGLLPLWAIIAGDSTGLRIVAILPIVGTAHILFVSRRLLAPLTVSLVKAPLANAALLLPMLLVAFCVTLWSESKLSRETLMQKRDAWLHQKPAAYSYELQISGWRGALWMLNPRHIQVRGDSVTSASYVGGPIPESYPAAARDAWTMDTVFAELLHAQEGGSRVRVRFDERWGYVQRAIIDSDDVDLSWELTSRNFEPEVDAK